MIRLGVVGYGSRINGVTLNEDCSSALIEFASGAHGIYTQVFYARRDAGARWSPSRTTASSANWSAPANRRP